MISGLDLLKGYSRESTEHQVIKNRASIVFHELKENYYRVHGKGYVDAHNTAVTSKKKFKTSGVRRSRIPGYGKLKR